MNNKVCFVVCWFGKLPSYLPVWIKSCSYNTNIDFLVFTDDDFVNQTYENVKFIPFTFDCLLKRVHQRLSSNASIKTAYRLCDFKPMYGIIFKEELQAYDYWGYCDLDLVFGNIKDFMSLSELYQYEGWFNAGHFSLLKNTSKMNSLFKCDGAIFDYKTVMNMNATFAFDEITGIQRIIKKNNINIKFGIPYIDADSRYTQLRSRMDKYNPNNQAFYWEDGQLIRVKVDNDLIYSQKVAYMHLQKRKIEILDQYVEDSSSFWITPRGYLTKEYMGCPKIEDIKNKNPYEGEAALTRQYKDYRKKKIMQILRRNPFQIYVRLVQEKSGINVGDGNNEDIEWILNDKLF